MLSKYFNKLFIVISAVTGIVPYFVEGLSLQTRIAISLFVVAVAFSVLYIRQGIELRKLRETHEAELRKLSVTHVENVERLTQDYTELEKKHKALARQYSQKKALISKYEKAVDTTSCILHIALANSKEAKLNDILSTFNKLINNINEGE